MSESARRWAEESFGGSDLGDARRSKRFVRMMGQAASTPGGCITRVFDEPASRQAAYDFVEHETVSSERVVDAIGKACARASRGQRRVLVALDGSSLSLTERAEDKGFGSVGTRSRAGRGLKVMNTLAMTESGVVIGIPTQQYWARGERVSHRRYRRRDERESVYWRHAVEASGNRFAQCAPDTTLHFIADREADAALLMRQLVRSGHEFTIRANGTRTVQRGPRRIGVRSALRKQREIGRVWLHVPAADGKPSRDAQLSLRVVRETLVLRDRCIGERQKIDVFIVLAREVGRVPVGHRRIEWLLYTTNAVKSARGAVEVLERYALRWRIEELHRTWKSGSCNVEQTQLRSPQAVIKWACMLAAVAARVERLKQLSRDQPEQPASAELSDDEITVLRLLKRKIAKRTEVITDDMPTIAEAVGWIADLGGYVRNKSNGPPGSAVIARGLERLTWSTEAFAAAQPPTKKR